MRSEVAQGRQRGHLGAGRSDERARVYVTDAHGRGQRARNQSLWSTANHRIVDIPLPLGLFAPLWRSLTLATWRSLILFEH